MVLTVVLIRRCVAMLLLIFFSVEIKILVVICLRDFDVLKGSFGDVKSFVWDIGYFVIIIFVY